MLINPSLSLSLSLSLLRIFIQNKHPDPAVCFRLLKGRDNHNMTIKKALYLEAWAGIQQDYMLGCASLMLDEIIVSSQLHAYHLSVAVCQTGMDIKRGCG